MSQIVVSKAADRDTNTCTIMITQHNNKTILIIEEVAILLV